MGKLNLKNTTNWNTSDLRKAVRVAEKQFELTESRKVIFLQAGPRGMRGRGTLPGPGQREGHWVKVYLPKTRPQDIDKFQRDALWLILHEVAHNAGLTHRAMGVSSPLNRVWGATEKPHAMADIFIQWEGAEKLTPEAATEARCAGVKDAVARRAAAVDAAVKKWARKLALAKTKLAHYQAKQRYYARKPAPFQFDHLALAAKDPAKEEA